MVMEHHQSIIPLGKKHALRKYNQFLSLYVVYSTLAAFGEVLHQILPQTHS